jgi:hypothetical protein
MVSIEAHYNQSEIVMANDTTEAVHAGLLARIKAHLHTQGRCPRPFELCEDPTQFTAIVKALEALERAGAIVRSKRTTWENYDLAKSGSKNRLVPRGGRRISEGRHLRGGRIVNGVHVYPRDFSMLRQIIATISSGQAFPGPSDLGRTMRFRLTDQDRGHVVASYARLEEAGLLTRTSKSWKLGGTVTDAGQAFLSALPEVIIRNAPAPSVRRIGGGLAANGGTRYPHMLRPASEGVLKFPTSLSKLGDRVTKTTAGGPARGRRIATYSLQEGRTCSPSCGLIDVCFAGKMFRERRIDYKGPETDEAIAGTIEARGPLHWRLHTVGDFPNEAYLDRVVAALRASGSTAWGYTHWTMADPLGEAIARQAKEHWGTFSVRLSYEAWGVRPPAHVPAAVVVRDFTPEVLKEHNAVPCPEQVQDEGLGHRGKRQINCGNCGLCWTAPHKTIAFKLH